MSHSPVPSLVLAAALSACVLEPELLNSERIEERFGNYGIEVLSQDGKLRRSNLFSTHAGSRICRTYAVVQFMDSPPLEIQASHQAVLAGRSLGSTFRDAGWAIGKDSLFVGGFSLTNPDSEILRLMRLAPGARLAMHAYRLVLERESESVHYATIIEVHHPDYLGLDELRELYDVAATDEADERVVAAFVALVESD